jgi:hypothetical protein
MNQVLSQNDAKRNIVDAIFGESQKNATITGSVVIKESANIIIGCYFVFPSGEIQLTIRHCLLERDKELYKGNPS